MAKVRVLALASWPAKMKLKVLPIIALEGSCAWTRKSATVINNERRIVVERNYLGGWMVY